jgi:tetratricopeptide (TPR) repeat protein
MNRFTKDCLLTKILILILFFSSLSGFAQTDSLFNALKDASDREKVDIFNNLSLEYANISLDSSLAFALKAYTLAREEKYTVGRVTALKQIGNYHIYQNNLKEALQYYDSALVLLKNNDKELPLVTLLMNNKGVVYDLMGDFSNALKLYKEALEIRRTIKDDKGVAQNLNNIGLLHYQKGDYNIAIDYLLQSLKIEEKIGNQEGVGQTYLNIGSIYYELGDVEQSIKYLQLALSIFREIGSKNTITALLNLGIYSLSADNSTGHAEKYLIEALQKSVEIEDETHLPEIYFNLGEVNKVKGDFEKAESYTNSAIKIAIESGNKHLEARAYQYMGDIQFEKKDITMAKHYYGNSLEIFEELGLKSRIANTYKVLAHLHSANKNYESAYNLFIQYSNLRDSVFSEEKHKQIAELQTKYDVEKKESELALLSKENELQKLKFKQSKTFFLSILFILSLTSFAFILLIQRKRLKANNQSLELQQRLLRAQMNPHFIFNSVAAIQNFIMKSKPIEASSYLSKFANLMRNILHQSKVEFVSLSKEVDMLDDYLKLQKLRLNNNLTYSITVGSDIDADVTAVPPLLLQPFIENAVEHGLLKKDIAEGTVDLDVSLINNELIFEITDDGIGRKASASRKPAEHHSMATEIVKNRLKLLRKYYPKEPDFQIIDLYDDAGKESGTKVIVRLSMKYLESA